MTITIDLTSLILCGVLLLLAVLTPLCSAFFRRVKGSDVTTPRPISVSIVMTVHDEVEAVERNLPLFLQQQSEAGYEVIVVDESSGSDTKDVLKRLRAQYPNLYTTFIPESSHYLSRRKLALTIGVKAAHNEWCILTDIRCKPADEHWLESMTAQMGDDTGVVLGLTGWEDDAPVYWRFERLLNNCYQMRRAALYRAYRYDGRSLGFRRSVFMSNNGFLSNLKYLRGEYDFIANEHGGQQAAAVSIVPSSMMVQERVARKIWKYDHLYYMESRKHLSRSLSWRLLHNTDQAVLQLNYLLEAASLAYSLLTTNWLLCAASVLSVLLTMLLRSLSVRKAARSYGEHLPLLLIPLLELRTVWQQLSFIVDHRLADKYDFIRR
jgi:glycosyltransferase involved in cell wall biosynthesis